MFGLFRNNNTSEPYVADVSHYGTAAKPCNHKINVYCCKLQLQLCWAIDNDCDDLADKLEDELLWWQDNFTVIAVTNIRDFYRGA